MRHECLASAVLPRPGIEPASRARLHSTRPAAKSMRCDTSTEHGSHEFRITVRDDTKVQELYIIIQYSPIQHASTSTKDFEYIRTISAAVNATCCGTFTYPATVSVSPWCAAIVLQARLPLASPSSPSSPSAISNCARDPTRATNNTYPGNLTVL